MSIKTIDALAVIPESVAAASGAEWAMVETARGENLAVLAPAPGPAWLADLEGDRSPLGAAVLVVGPLGPTNARALRRHLPWLAPRPLGGHPSAGFGDRLGLATPGHLQATRATGSLLAPVLAQQSIREMTRTGRTPQQVLDDAVWGAFRSGWRQGFGADGDHLKTTADIDGCLAAGYSLFTFDPGAYVNDGAGSLPRAEEAAAFEALPWVALEDRPADLERRYVKGTWDIEGRAIEFDRETLITAAVKYGRAVAHVVALYRHLVQKAAGRPFEVEISVDETEAPTTGPEHVFVASELRRLGVDWVSLAPRFVGRFEKGVDYVGDRAAFEADCALHAAIARTLGPYKVSLHSGSDKFSIYAAAARSTRGLVHLKTAGTSYLEALRTLAVADPLLLRDIYEFARAHYDTDRASYHVSATVGSAPDAGRMADGDLGRLLDDVEARQILHVTFGSVLSARDAGGAALFRDRLMSALRRNRAAYAANLEAHFVRHLQPFADVLAHRQAD